MTLLIKITLTIALLLSIAVPFGVFAAGEKTRGRYKRALAVNTLLFMGTLLVAAGLMFTGNAVAAETAETTAGSAAGWGYLAAALSTGMSCVGGSLCCSGCHQRGWLNSRKISHLRRSCRRCMSIRVDHFLHDPWKIIIL